MAVDLTWSSPTAAQSSSGLALVTGDILTQTSWQATVSNIYLLSQLAQGPGQLQYVSSTSIRFRAVNGSVIRIAGALYNLTADITAANTNIYIDGASGSSLGTSTLYYVYLFRVGSTLTIDFSTTAYAIDSTSGNYGTYIKSGVASRTLIGMIRTNSSSQFVDSSTQRFVRSWYNDPGIAGVNGYTANRTTTSASFTELNTEIRIEFLAWTGEIVSAHANITMSNDNASSESRSGLAFDSTTVPDDAQHNSHEHGTANRLLSTGLGLYKAGLSEGYHYLTLLGTVNVGTGTWLGAAAASTRTTIWMMAHR